jgi:hypothetical protein
MFIFILLLIFLEGTGGRRPETFIHSNAVTHIGTVFLQKDGSVQSLKDEWRLSSEHWFVMWITSDTEQFFKISARQ